MFSDAACVQYASSWAKVIVDDHYSGPGEMENALHSAAREAKVPHGFLWKLRYRKSSVKLAPFGYLLSLALAYRKKRQAGARAHDPKADAVAAEFQKLAETFRGFNSDLYREAADDLLASAGALGAANGDVGAEGSAVAGGRAQ